MSFQLNGFQCNAFQVHRQNQRPSGGYGQAWITYGDKSGKRKILATLQLEDDELLVIAKAFVDSVLR